MYPIADTDRPFGLTPNMDSFLIIQSTKLLDEQALEAIATDHNNKWVD